MKAWMQKNFTIGGIITLITMIATLFSVIGAVYLFADKVDQHEISIIWMKPKIEANMKHTERTDIHPIKDVIAEKYVSKPVFDQFQKQLFNQLDRLEEKLDK